MAGPPASALLVTGLARPLQNQASETYRNEVSSNADHQQRTFRSHPSRQVGPTLPAWGRSIGLEDGSKQEPSPGQSGRGLLVFSASIDGPPAPRHTRTTASGVEDGGEGRDRAAHDGRRGFGRPAGGMGPAGRRARVQQPGPD